MTASKSGGRASPGKRAGLPPAAARKTAKPTPHAAKDAHTPAAAAPTTTAPATPGVAAEPHALPGIIEIDPVITTGFTFDRFDIHLRGRIVSRVPIEELAVHVDDRLIGQSIFSPEGRVVRATLPDGTRGLQYAFIAPLMLPAEEAEGPCIVVLTARGADGHAITATIELLIDPGDVQAARIVRGAQRSAATYPNPYPPIILYAERAVIDDGGYLLVHGWAVALQGLSGLDVYVDEKLVGAARHGLPRSDVGQIFPAYPGSGRSGFTLAIPIAAPGPAIAFARIEALGADGARQEMTLALERTRDLELAPSTEPPPETTPASAAAPADPDPLDPRRKMHLFCDQAAISHDGQVIVHGWSVCSVGITTITVQLNGKTLGNAELGLPRDDVGSQFPDIATAAKGGFRFQAQVAPPGDGQQVITVTARNPFDDNYTQRHECDVVEIVAPRAANPAEEFHFQMDNPVIAGGVMTQPVTGRLTIEGWVLARSGVAVIDVLLDDTILGQAHLGLARQDVGAAFPDWPNSLRSGYAFHCPPRSLRNGDHNVAVRVRAVNGLETTHSFKITVRKPDQEGEGIGLRRRLSLVERQVWTRVLDRLGRETAFRFVIAQTGRPNAALLGTTLAGLRSQIVDRWRLLIVVADNAAQTAMRKILAEIATDLSGRIDLMAARDAAARAPFGNDRAGEADELYCFLAAGDVPGADALAEITLAHGQHPDAELIYVDELCLSPASNEREPFCKPDFSPDLLLSTNYIGRLWSATPAMLRRIVASPDELLKCGSYDLVLRAAEAARTIHHIPRVLCQRGPTTANPVLEQEALARTAARRGEQAAAVPAAVPGTWRYQRLTQTAGLVSIIIPTCAAHGHIETCINTLRSRTAYPNIEIIVIDNIPTSELRWKLWIADHADMVVEIPEAFNWSRFNNRAAAFANGEYLLFLNDDIEITQDDWLHALLEHAARPEVGVTGPQLLYPSGSVQHAGMFLASGGIGRHAFRFAAADEPGYFGLALTQRNVIAVTGACMLMRRAVFNQLGGFDEAHDVINNDLDFCLRVHEAGLVTVYTPYASLIHHELASRDRIAETFDLSHFEHRWRAIFSAGDPYFSPALSRQADDYRPDDEAAQIVHAGNPRFASDEIRTILVSKLDHIGDFITALPAIRQLKAIFPAAKIHVLASRGAKPFAEMEAAVDGFIEFEFFHARSGLGQKELTEADFRALGERLAPYDFDLAIDLRKHLDTREVMRHVPARLRAGFDRMGQFPFLDIALEWEGDQNMHRKHSHVSEDMLNLIAAVATAAMPMRNAITLPPRKNGALHGFVPDHLRSLFDKPVIAVHPGVGNIMRQWPGGHFAALIDMLTDAHDLNVILIGGPDEAELADEVLGQVANAERVTSLAGATALADLPYLLAACALYIGNNSGPKHIAAALGVPTIGIHSGVVDAGEWAPLGVEAVAIQRQMTCFPCYLARPEDCPRGIACLTQLDPAAVFAAANMLLARPITGRVPAEPATQAASASPKAVAAKPLTPPSTPQPSRAKPSKTQAAKPTISKAAAKPAARRRNVAAEQA